MRVVWAEQAFLRLSKIRAYIAADSPAAADKTLERLIDRGERLSRFPKSGRRVPEFPRSELREVIEGNYRIVYRVAEGTLEILTVFEGHQRFPAGDIPGI